MKTTPLTSDYNRNYNYHYYLPPGIDEQGVVDAAAKRLRKEGERSLVHSHKYDQQCDGFDHRVFDQQTLDDIEEKRNAKTNDAVS